MNARLRGHLSALILFGVVINSCPSNAQYTADFQTNIISGVASNWASDYYVGNTSSSDALLMEGGGALTNDFYTYVGYDVASSNNSVLVTDPASVWHNGENVYVGYGGTGNSLVISNGGQVISDGFTTLGTQATSSNNTAVVTGAGSVWSYGVELRVGWYGSGNNLLISSGGQAIGTQATLGNYGGGGNSALVTGTGSVWSNAHFGVGAETGYGNSLVIRKGGLVVDGSAGVAFSRNNVLVTDPGSIWENSDRFGVGVVGVGNQLSISNGGIVYCGEGALGGGGNGSSNTVLVTGSGSVWSIGSSLFIGGSGLDNELIITNGGVVRDIDALIGEGGSDEGPSDDNVVSISGGGAIWQNQGSLYVGYYGLGNLLNIGVGGSVTSSNAYIGFSPYYRGNQISVLGGGLYVTNAIGDGTLNVNRGTLSLDDGTVTVDSLCTSPGTNNFIKFNDGVLNTKSTAISNAFTFTVGNGTNAATLNLAPGGTGFHFFANGLTISSNAMLKGIGTVIGATMINAGGVLAPGDGPGSITFSNNLTLAAGSTLALTLNGTGAGQYSQIIGLGTIGISNCILNVSLGYSPACGDSFTIISNLTSSAILGAFVTTDGMALPNGADFVVDNRTFQIDYGTFCSGFDVTLTTLIPEPSSLIMTALGVMSLCVVLNRKRARVAS